MNLFKIICVVKWTWLFLTYSEVPNRQACSLSTELCIKRACLSVRDFRVHKCWNLKMMQTFGHFWNFWTIFEKLWYFWRCFAILANFGLFTFRHLCCVWGGKNCQRRFGKTLPQSWKRCQLLATKIRTRWCGQNWRTGVYQTQTASQVGKKIFVFWLIFPPKIISSIFFFRLAECESTVGNLGNKLDSLEKSKVKLQTEIESKN